MSLLEDARTRRPRPNGPACKVQRALVAHPSLAADIVTVLRDRAIPHVAAAETFHKYGIDIGHLVVEGHRTHGCAHCRYADTDLSPLTDVAA